ncbi:DNA recombination protein RmuC [Sinorhizobium sp. BG8]|uniref:DNA recombination protein RmuC n=1 Tax=Sinorhizobium sp. BG8 TaxID=2613773 RepID=UPI00193D2645|nr:DNA recombination protein RmuC [Sinorhizobium sp. BG8]QRM54042.1 DNA recombination protein RmuC [Sinorhizobium sp. BG8]
MDFQSSLHHVVIRASETVSRNPALALASLGFLVLVALTIGLARRSNRRDAEAASSAQIQLGELLKAQTELQGRVAAMAEVFGARQAETNQAINQRLDGLTQRLGQSISEQTRATHDNLRKLQERLAVIDSAQTNIQSLAKDVVGLQAILSNKQTRGAFGQARMETIVADGLPQGAYGFQQQLSTGVRPDCTIRMPNGQPPLVIDAKFPLEAWNAIAAAGSPEAAKAAATQFRRDMEVHIRDIAEKYLIAGETQDTAFLFVPSESIFAAIHESFEMVVQRAHRARIVIVSPSLLLLSIQVLQALFRDQRMREQAHVIQAEVVRLMDDLTRLDDRVRKLHGHFTAAQKDVDQILTSTEKLARRGSRIGEMEFEQPAAAPPSSEPGGRSVESRTGQLKLRVVDED